jgi:hypothetical protein
MKPVELELPISLTKWRMYDMHTLIESGAVVDDGAEVDCGSPESF